MERMQRSRGRASKLKKDSKTRYRRAAKPPELIQTKINEVVPVLVPENLPEQVEASNTKLIDEIAASIDEIELQLRLIEELKVTEKNLRQRLKILIKTFNSLKDTQNFDSPVFVTKANVPETAIANLSDTDFEIKPKVIHTEDFN